MSASETTVLTVDAESTGPTIHPNVYGHFAEHLGRCIYEGVWVGDSAIENLRGIRSDVVQALTELQVPVLRWPGGCFADEYHWRDGIGPREQRPRRINSHWGGVVENNHFGTHEFMDLCEQLGAAPYVCGNVGSGTPREMMQWVEYISCGKDTTLAELRRRNGRDQAWRLPYFGIGNENWACGGNMGAEYYADNYLRYATFIKDYGGGPVQRIACGAADADYRWTEVLMARAAQHMAGLSLHYYTLPSGSWTKKGSATQFAEDEWHSTFFRTLKMETLLREHCAIMDRFDPERSVALCVDEWGAWYDVEPGSNPGFLYQQNTLRDALVAALNLHLFHGHAARVRMANLAQTVNVLQSVLLTDGPRVVRTPTYHVYAMYKVHQGASVVPVKLDSPQYTLADVSVPQLSASASRSASGVHLSVVNLHPTQALVLEVRGLEGEIDANLLSADEMNGHNTFDRPDLVKPRRFENHERAGQALKVHLPSKCVLMITAHRG